MLEHLSVVSDELRRRAHIINDEALWPKSVVIEVLREIAAADRVILGFDIVSMSLLKGWRPSVYGTSAYDSELDLKCRWEECVQASLTLALRDVKRTKELSELGPPRDEDDDVWYSIVSISRGEQAKIRHEQREAADGRIARGIITPKRDGPS